MLKTFVRDSYVDTYENMDEAVKYSLDIAWEESYDYILSIKEEEKTVSSLVFMHEDHVKGYVYQLAQGEVISIWRVQYILDGRGCYSYTDVEKIR